MDGGYSPADAPLQMSLQFRVRAARAAGVRVTVVAACGLLGCSSSSSSASHPDGGHAGPGANVDAGDDLGGGDGSSSVLDGGSAADDAGADGSGNGGTDLPRGVIFINQALTPDPNMPDDVIAHFRITAIFATQAEYDRERAAATITTIGSCSATVLTDPGDGGMLAPVSGLNAGNITVTGMAVPPSASLVFTPTGDGGPSSYASPSGDTQFFSGGDSVSVQGAGGADLPAFAPQTVIAPDDVHVTTPGCGAQCPPIDRSKDMLVQWMAGGAGKVQVTLEGDSDTQTVLVQCTFDAAAGTGMVPSALLLKLDPGGSGLLQISGMNQVVFPVGGVSTSFTLYSSPFELLPTFSN
jgi:hypothetical protein